MDQKIDKKKNPSKKIALIALPLLLLGFALWSAFDANQKVRIKKERLRIKTVTKGQFEDMALFNAQVHPLNTLQINSIESGSVKKIYAQNGDIVTEGQLLLELYNPNAELGYLTQETAIIEQINNLRNTRIAIKNQQMLLDRDLIEMTYNYNNAERQYSMDTTLYRKGVISKNDYVKSQETYSFQSKQQQNIKVHVKKEQQDRANQLHLINASITKMEESLEQLRQNKENFIVKAPASGLLSSFNPILGKSYNKSELIGKLDMQDGYKLVLAADEYYFNDVAKGQEAHLEMNDSLYPLFIKNIVAEVVNGKFQVELNFKEKAPKSINQGMTVPVKLYLSKEEKSALLLPKGTFYTSSGGQFVFVLTSDSKAVKRSITIGKVNAHFYEVLDGLQEGDRVITSSYNDYKDKDILYLED
ncbi:efflux RND transporter periplasmic adaptor subunit [Croceivirga radicis]|uniref:efflux RND transporter periplasmic adaptor subunit n=1 Tax=Croceivirga radicis TaxID=1929488 RepID=UPI000497A9C5|nr:hypothetical protein [Croceivirga radicis]